MILKKRGAGPGSVVSAFRALDIMTIDTETNSPARPVGTGRDDDVAARAEELIDRARAAYDSGRYDEALELGLDVMAVSDQLPPDLELRSLNVVGIAYGELGHPGKELEFFLEALAVARRHDHRRGLLLGHNNLAYFHLTVGEPERALEHLDRAVEFVDAVPEARALLARNRSQGYIDTDRLDLAHEQAELALELAIEGGWDFIQWYALNSLGQIARKRARWIDAIGHFRAVVDAGAHGESLVNSLSEMAECHRELGDDAAAIACLERSLEHLEQQSQRYPLLRCLEQLYITHKVARRFEEALGCLERVNRLQIELHEELSQMQVRALDARHRVEMFQQESSLLRQKNEELAQLNESIRELSIRDDLSGLHNRRHLFEQARVLNRLAERYDRPLTIAMLDIDNFKAVNDGYGHAAGDEVIREVGRILRSLGREADIAARYGGEEFVLVMPETTVSGAAQACERIREAVAANDWGRIEPGLSVTISIGIAGLGAGRTCDDVLSIADEQLYRAKRAGRDQVCAEGLGASASN